MSTSKDSSSQHAAFAEGEADAYFQRNHSDGVVPTDGSHGVIRAIGSLEWAQEGRCLDLGGSAGGLCAAISETLPKWSFTVTDPSPAAVNAGRQAFPRFDFRIETAEGLCHTNHGRFNLVIVSAVLHWIDRCSLARVVANIDEVLEHRGHLVIHDFDPAFPRMNEYKHRSGIWTYKQNYPAIFTSLGTYELIYVRSCDSGSSANPNDPYDRRWATSVLRKTMNDRYCR